MAGQRKIPGFDEDSDAALELLLQSRRSSSSIPREAQTARAQRLAELLKPTGK